MLGATAPGVRELVRHLRGGGVMAILLDQYVKGGEPIDFLGHPAPTGTDDRRAALKYGLPMIPVYGTRQPDGVTSPSTSRRRSRTTTRRGDDPGGRRQPRRPGARAPRASTTGCTGAG